MDATLADRLTFGQRTINRFNRPSHTFVCPAEILERVNAMRADWPQQEIVYLDSRGKELMRVALDQMPTGMWIW